MSAKIYQRCNRMGKNIFSIKARQSLVELGTDMCSYFSQPMPITKYFDQWQHSTFTPDCWLLSPSVVLSGSCKTTTTTTTRIAITTVTITINNNKQCWMLDNIVILSAVPDSPPLTLLICTLTFHKDRNYHNNNNNNENVFPS